MHSLFQEDKPWIIFLNRFFDIMVLNIIFLITSVPLITIGASMTALNGITLQMAEKKETYIVKEYFHIFKSKFKKATGMWIIFLLATSFLFLDLYCIFHYIDSSYGFFQYPVLLLLFLSFSIQLYYFPLLATQKSGISELLKNSILLSLGYLPKTVVFLCLYLFPAIIATLKSNFFIPICSLYLFFGFAGINYLVNKLFFPILCSIEGPDDV